MDSIEYVTLTWVSLVLALVLFIMSCMSVGKHAYDLYYQILKDLNGIRWIQSWINLRTHGNRVLFAMVYGIAITLFLIEVNMETRAWVSRILFFCVLVIFAISSVLDWVAEAKQLKILIHFEEVNNVAKMRIDLHALNSRLTELFGYVEFLDKKDRSTELDIEKLQIDIKELVKTVQRDLHQMDPSYRNDK